MAFSFLLVYFAKNKPFPQYRVEAIMSKRRASFVMEQSTEMRVVLMMPEGFAAFKNFLSKEFSVENILFWHEARIYRDYAQSSTADPIRVTSMAKAVYDHYFREGSVLQINVSFEISKSVQSAVEAIEKSSELDLAVAADAFQDAAKHIFGVMIHDPYPRFTRSAEFLAIQDKVTKVKLEYAMHAADQVEANDADLNTDLNEQVSRLVAQGSSDALQMNPF